MVETNRRRARGEADPALPPGVELQADIVYGEGGGRPLRLDLLRPHPPPAGPLPAIVGVHGGAFRGGTKEMILPRLIPFARRGFLCASVEYRLSGEAIFPGQIEDCKCAVRFLRAHAAELGLDPDRIGAWGSSAGGHLVALLGTSADVADLEGGGGWAGHSSRVRAVCVWYGSSDLLRMGGADTDTDYDAPDSPVSRLVGGPIQEHPDRAARANPCAYVTGDEPPFLILHGDADRVVPWRQSAILYEALGGTDVTFHTVRGAGHGGPAFEHPATLRLVAAFFDRHLRPGAAAPADAADGQPDGPGRDPGPAPAIVTVASRSWVNPDTAPPLTAYRTFDSPAAGGPVGYALYLPPGYAADPSRRYPVIYWLHGMGGDPRRGAAFVVGLDRAIREGVAPPAIAVLPTSGPASTYCDAADGSWPVERVIVEDLLPHIDAAYRTIPGRAGRCIEGQSMGGFGAARLGFGHPDLFGAVSIAAGALIDLDRLLAGPARLFRSVWGGDRAYFEACNPWTIARRNADRIRGRTRVRLFCGDQDQLLDRNARFHELLDELGIAHEWIVVPGAGHGYDDKIARLGLGSFAFFAAAFARPDPPGAREER